MRADNAALKELVRVLEQAVQAGVTSVGLEYEDREFRVYYNSGSLGVSADCIAKDLEWAVIKELRKRAGLGRKSTGKLRVKLRDKDFSLEVEEFESFGEPQFSLKLKERKE